MRHTVLIFGLTFLLCIKTVFAQSVSLIRDAEIEETLQTFSKPLFEKAGLNASAMQIHLVADDKMNAFATKGLHIFIHTGLILRADNAQELLAVIAHETGHIAGGHIVRLYENLALSQRGMLVSMLLGGLAVAAGGGSEAAMGAILGGMNSSQSLFASYRRAEENAADQMAISLLLQTGHDLSGFESVMRKLKKQEDYQSEQIYDLWRSHPFIKERLGFVLNQRELLEKNSPINHKKIAEENALFERVQAKLFAFLYAPSRTFERYPQTDKSFGARYARSIALYRVRKFKEALEKLENLISENPQNAFLYELKGQFLFETGEALKASEAYKKAVSLSPHSTLLRLGLIQALVDQDTKDSLFQAKQELSFFSSSLPTLPEAWRLQALVYGRLNETGKATYALAEYNFARQDFKKALFFAKQALLSLSQGSPSWIRAQDIVILSKKSKSKE